MIDPEVGFRLIRGRLIQQGQALRPPTGRRRPSFPFARRSRQRPNRMSSRQTLNRDGFVVAKPVRTNHLDADDLGILIDLIQGQRRSKAGQAGIRKPGKTNATSSRSFPRLAVATRSAPANMLISRMGPSEIAQPWT